MSKSDPCADVLYKNTYKYIYFHELPPSGKTHIWACRDASSHCEIGRVKWYPDWRQYCFFPNEAVFSAGCLRDVTDFLGRVQAERRP